MGIIENKRECIFWQIENNDLKLSGPSEQENGWWKELNPGEIFETIKAAIGFEKNINGVFGEMTKYQRTLAYRSEKDAGLPVIFNDYMMCLNADPSTEKELAVIDAAAKVGAEIYCMDAGWYADGTWWKTVGEWKVCEGRFKNGMGEVFDYIRQKGMKPRIWLEPEVMGINCPILYKFTDDCFFTRHGKKVIDHGRYHFDYRNKKVTDFLNGVVDGLINDYGIEYFKFDYNIDGGVGTEIDSDSFGDGLMEHCNAYLNWVDGLYSRHPGLIIENCASGGMRMDYKSLSHFSSKVQCAECGGWYGSKVWHSNDKYRRVIYQCNNKFRHKTGCSTTHLTEFEIKDYFVKAVNQLITEKAEILDNLQLIRTMLCDKADLIKQKEALEEEINVTVEMTQNIVGENASVAQNQDEYNKKYNSLMERYNKLKEEYDEVCTTISDKDAKYEQMGRFIKVLKGQDELITEFDESLWSSLAEKILVKAKDDVMVVFKDFTEIKAE